MSKYPLASLHGKISIKHGYPFKSQFFSDAGDHIVLTPGNFLEEGGFKRQIGKEKFYTGEIPEEYLHSKGDLIVAMTEQAAGLLGSCAFVPENDVYLHNQRLGLITTSDDCMNMAFIYYLFKTPNVRNQIRQSSSGSKVKHTSPERIYDVVAPIPKKEEQERIAQVLLALDKKIELNNKINTELEAMAKLIYDYWFVQFDFPDANGKPYKSSGGKMVYNEELKRDIPDGWGVSLFGTYNIVKKGELITRETSSDGKIKVVAAGINYSYYHSTPNHKKNTITVSGSGASAGFVNFWREPIFASDCITVRGNTDAETLLALHYLKLIQGYIFKQARGSAQPHVYPNDISQLNYILPPKDLVERYGNTVLDANEKISVNKRENENLVELRDWLLPMLMNGQVRVKS